MEFDVFCLGGRVAGEGNRARALSASGVERDIDFPKLAKRGRWKALDLDDARPAAALQATGATLVRREERLSDPSADDGRLPGNRRGTSEPASR